MKQITILGASGHGKVVADIARLCGYESIVFLDDDKTKNYCGRYPVAGRCTEWNRSDGDIIVAIGDPAARRQIQESLEPDRLVTLVHPDAVTGEDVVIGRGSVIMAGVVINPGTVVGTGCIVNTAASLDHDCRIGDYVHIAAGAHVAGSVRIKDLTWVGAGSTVSNGITVCGGCIIGAGAVVVEDIRKKGVYAGVPATLRKKALKCVCGDMGSGGRQKKAGRQTSSQKHALVTATLGRTLGFEVSDIKILQELGYTVHCAADFRQDGQDDFRLQGIIRHQTEFVRHPFSPSNLKAYIRLKRLMSDIKPQLVHCHTPVAGVITRIAARRSRKQGTKVLYTAHGFHFYKGAPVRNWLLYYPVEWLLSFWTDVLITINREDYRRAGKYLHAGRTVYIPGVGIDLEKFRRTAKTEEKRRELLQNIRDSLHVLPDALLLVSVGELNRNKNHKTVIRALAGIKNADIHYVIAGTGPYEKRLIKLIHKLGLDDRVHLAGFRNDVDMLYRCGDICVFPSFREGLGLAAIEGMAAGIPLICSATRGSFEYARHMDNAVVCRPGSVKEWRRAIQFLAGHPHVRKQMGRKNKDRAIKFDQKNVKKRMVKLYQNV